MKVWNVSISQEGGMSTHILFSAQKTTSVKAMQAAKDWLATSKDAEYYRKLYKDKGWNFDLHFDHDYWKCYVQGPFQIHIASEEID